MRRSACRALRELSRLTGKIDPVDSFLQALIIGVGLITNVLVISRTRTILNPVLLFVLLWAVLLVALMAVGFATMMIGMILLLPLVGHATWHAYKDMVE